MENIKKLEIYVYLDALRERGTTNMFGAVPFIQKEFDMPTKEARECLSSWMKDFGK